MYYQHAARYGHLPIVELLCASGAKVNCTSEKGESSVTLAAGAGYLAVVKFLHHRGADICRQGIKGCTALMSAARYACP